MNNYNFDISTDTSDMFIDGKGFLKPQLSDDKPIGLDDKEVAFADNVAADFDEDEFYYWDDEDTKKKKKKKKSKKKSNHKKAKKNTDKYKKRIAVEHKIDKEVNDKIITLEGCVRFLFERQLHTEYQLNMIRRQIVKDSYENNLSNKNVLCLHCNIND